jgi:hypothetical protein
MSARTVHDSFRIREAATSEATNRDSVILRFVHPARCGLFLLAMRFIPATEGDELHSSKMCEYSKKLNLQSVD